MNEAQLKARRVVQDAADKIIAEIDASPWRHDATEFRADFHLSCIKHGQCMMNGQPTALEYDRPIFASASAS